MFLYFTAGGLRSPSNRVSLSDSRQTGSDPYGDTGSQAVSLGVSWRVDVFC